MTRVQWIGHFLSIGALGWALSDFGFWLVRRGRPITVWVDRCALAFAAGRMLATFPSVASMLWLGVTIVLAARVARRASFHGTNPGR